MQSLGRLVSTATLLLLIHVFSRSCLADRSRQRLVSAHPRTEGQLKALAHYLTRRSQLGHVDVWNLPRDVTRRTMFSVAEENLDTYADWLERRDINYHVEHEDLKSLAERYASYEDSKQPNPRLRSLATETDIDLDVYNDHQKMNLFLENVTQSCDVCRVIYIGQSYEQRDMNVIKIGRVEPWKKFVWLDAGIHAREWIASATALKLIDKLVRGHRDNDPDVRWLLDHYVLYILPSANPDGYMFSRNEDRYWRKTRSPNDQCVGTDPNRNWDYHWAEKGTSRDPCSEIYVGPEPFSEVENRNIRDFLYHRRDRFLVYLSLHSYGQYWLYPWGYDDVLPDDWMYLHIAGSVGIKKIKEVTGTDYTLGVSAIELYPAAGASDDWAKGVANITYSYTVELRDTGEHGFLLPSDQIEPSAAEMYAGILAMIRHGIDPDRRR